MTSIRIGLYPGTFDPVTFGHLDIIARSAALFDRLVVAVARNEGKQPLLSLEERIGSVRTCVADLGLSASVEVLGFEGLLVDAATAHGAHTIVRGLRGAGDFDFETQMFGTNRRLAPGIETVFLLADEQHRSTASRIVKEIARLGGDIAGFVPASVLPLVHARVGRV
ncbi:phosphopantetheine adenylyltransferase [Tanticharoenia sakaeratensis NBRC 103193]|uniref:Phosphopantetheine adenylyltransferase n=3 Tax=Tanticharoenia TaxID=444052 RepID=A0A0D6MQ60_9PROT|nr:pantetheine-phosphate adenylyltransferase [Tanticharoenia sakaeratensis]GAN55809.1 phosphopantetheine adenylyltransferase [Tanticharoenia sakaeratensis NBRC 103193]